MDWIGITDRVRRAMRSGSVSAAALLVAAFPFGTLVCAQELTGSSTATTSDAKSGKDKEETCRISGMVVKMVDGGPLKNATVRLENDQDREHSIATRTGADGRYELRNVPAGRYKMKASRNGYVEKEYGQVKQSDPGAMLALSPGQQKESVIFKMIPAAVISGRVFDEDGEPAPNAAVTASREVFHEGRRTIRGATGTQTDDLGQFRLFGLPPGRYFVSAVENGWGSKGDREFTVNAGQGPEKGYARTYYPGTPDPARASTITVKAGEEVAGTDIQLKQVTVYRIRGKVLNQVTHKSGSETYLQLVSRTKRLDWDYGAGQQVRKSDGSFEFEGVVPGPYSLMAYWSDGDKFYSTQERIEVAGSDLEGVSLTIGAGTTIPGHIRWEGKPSLERGNLSVSLRPADSAGWWGGSGRLEENQQFTLKNIGDGDYKVSIEGLSKDCYIKDTVYGDTHSADDTVSVGKGSGANLEVTISSRGARVRGAVVDKDELPAAGVWVVAVPEESRRSISRLFKWQTTDQYGKFDLHGLAPGTYKLFSWTGIENGEWEDGDFLKAFEGKGETVEVQDDDAKTINLRVIEKKSERGE